MTPASSLSDTPADSSQIVASTLQNLGHLGSLPTVALKVMELTDDPDATFDDVNQVIANDPSLSVRILKVVNSSFYGLPRQIASIERAVMLLGLSAVKNIVIAASLHKVFRSKQLCEDLSANDLWIHSVAVATSARALARKTDGALPDEAFLAGLIHDVGIIVEMQACQQRFARLIQLISDDSSLTFREAELQVFGATHEAFGAGLCRRWNFPLHLEHTAGFHHDPTQLPEAQRLLPAIVHLADILAGQCGAGYTGTVESLDLEPPLLRFLDLADSDIAEITASLPDAIQEAQQLLSGNSTS